MLKRFIGCDVSKGYADFIILDENKTIIENSFRLDDTPKGYKALLNMISTMCAELGADAICVYIGVESTGGFENNWLNQFELMAKKLPVKSARINPNGIKHYMLAQLKRNKTDQISAQAVAEYMIVHGDKVLFNQDDPYYSARRYWAGLILLKKQHSQSITHLQQLLYSTNPSVLIYCRHGFASWLINVLAIYPTAYQLAQANEKRMTKIAFVTQSRAQAMIRAAQECALQKDPVAAQHISSMIKHIQQIDQRIQNIERELQRQWKDDKAVQLIDSIKGIGFISALGLLINIRDIKLYPTVKHLVSYCGLYPVNIQSGDGVWKSRMCKTGRTQPRSVLYMVVCSALRCNPCIRDAYIRYKRSTNHRKETNNLGAIGACMHKMLRIVYGVLKNQTPFDPAIELRHRQKTPSMTPADQTKACEEKLRRFQQIDSAAPVSKRQAEKRKKAESSQSAQGTECGINTCLEESKNTLSPEVIVSP